MKKSLSVAPCPESCLKMGLSKLNKTFLHFFAKCLGIFDDSSKFYCVPSECFTLKNHQKYQIFGKKMKKSLVQPLLLKTHTSKTQVSGTRYITRKIGSFSILRGRLILRFNSDFPCDQFFLLKQTLCTPPIQAEIFFEEQKKKPIVL